MDHFQRGLGAKGTPSSETAPAGDAVEAALLFGLGRAQAATVDRYHRDEVMVAIGRSFDYYCEVGDAAHAVAVAENPILSLSAGWSSGLARIINRALELD